MHTGQHTAVRVVAAVAAVTAALGPALWPVHVAGAAAPEAGHAWAAADVPAPRARVDDASAASLPEVRRHHGGATADLADVRAAVAAAARDLDATEVRVREASTALAELDADLADAEDAHAEARRAETEASSRLREVDGDLASLLTDHEQHHAALARRVADAFKYGGALPQDVLVRGVTDADHWHHVAVTVETVQRLAAEEQASLQRAATTARTVASTRSRADTAHAEAVAAAAAASRREAEVAALRDQQRAITAELAREEADRAALLERFERSEGAQAALVDHLEDQLTRLEQLERAQRDRAATRASGDGPTSSPGSASDHLAVPTGGPPPGWARWLPADGQPWAPAIEVTAARHGLDARLLAALVWTESNFRPDVVSRAGAIGLSQLMPGTARGLRVDPHDPLQNLDGGARYLRTQLDRFGRSDLALAAYNAGPGRVRGAIPDITETRLYVVRVLDRYEQLAR